MRDGLRRGTWLGLASGVPLAFWWAFQDVSPLPGAEASLSPLAAGVRGLWIAQALGLPLVGLRRDPNRGWCEAMAEPIYGFLVPLPLLLLAPLSGAVGWETLAKGLLGLCLYAALLAVGFQLLDRKVRPEALRLGLGHGVSIVLAAASWTHRGIWLGWLGLG